MSVEEIERALARPAAAAKRGAWKWLARTAAFAWDDVYVRHGAFDAKKDHGPMIDPKLFRRLCTWAVNARAKMEAGSFEDYLVKHPDGCYETKAFLAQGITAAPHRRLSDFVAAAGKTGVKPGEPSGYTFGARPEAGRGEQDQRAAQHGARAGPTETRGGQQETCGRQQERRVGA